MLHHSHGNGLTKHHHVCEPATITCSREKGASPQTSEEQEHRHPATPRGTTHQQAPGELTGLVMLRAAPGMSCEERGRNRGLRWPL